MSKFTLIEIEKEESEYCPDYGSLDMKRETEFRVYENRTDQYGNERSVLLMTTPNIICAKMFLRSCKLTVGIIIED